VRSMATGSPTTQHTRSVVARMGALALSTLLLSCALVVPPTAQLATARGAVSDAEAAGADTQAPTELAAARDKLVQAESRVRRGHMDEAELLADQAAADARLAAMKARAAAAEVALGLIRPGASDALNPRDSTSAPDETVEGTRGDVLAAASDPLIGRYARAEIEGAEVALAEAERHERRGSDSEVVAHWVYLARQRAATAREAAKLRHAEEEIRLAGEGRQQEVAGLRRTEDEAVAARMAVPSGALDRSWARASGGDVTVILGDDQFEEGRAEVNSRADPNIDRIAALLRADQRLVVRLESHSDDTGSRSRSIEFSGRRAEAVRQALVARGIEIRRITVLALGESYPVASNETSLGRERNRRVEAVVGAPTRSGALN
jgi:outer membrane protein OmpA-like peptidoglycan-associated protein